MTKNCEKCGKKLPFLTIFTGESLCRDCKKIADAEINIKEQQAKIYLQEMKSKLATLEEEIIATKKVTEKQKELLKKQDKPSALVIYSNIYNRFEADKELDGAEINTLQIVQDMLGLTDEDVGYNERVRPYIYVYAIKKEGRLPLVDLKIVGGQPILKKGEILHFADKAVLKELKTINLGYEGGSQGVSIRIAKGISYRVGSYRGHIIKEDRFVATSQGNLIITNQRLFLYPFPGNMPLSVPLTKILSYHCYRNGLEVYKEGREKGYFFSMANGGSVEIFGLCLGHLLTQGD